MNFRICSMLVFALFEIAETSGVLDARFRMLFVACVGLWQATGESVARDAAGLAHPRHS